VKQNVPIKSKKNSYDDKMDKLDDEHALYLPALLKRSIQRKKAQKAKKRELFGSDKFTSTC